jgi:hypothetical protein
MHQPLSDDERKKLQDAKRILEAVYALSVYREYTDCDPKVTPALRQDWADFATRVAIAADDLDAVLATTMIDGYMRS